jgi:hypothetical protein
MEITGIDARGSAQRARAAQKTESQHLASSSVVVGLEKAAI